MHVGTVVALTGRTYTNSIGDPDESLYISRYVQLMLNAWANSTAQVQSVVEGNMAQKAWLIAILLVPHA